MATDNNKRIAKNTFFLYIRMFITMLVGLYTSRVVLQVLGITDFGIYNIVGGVVAMFGFISNTMATASQRFLAFEIGRNDLPALKRTFSVTLSIYILFSILIILLGESLGLWFVMQKLTIPPDRMYATIWTYQLALWSFILIILRIPFNAAIIAHEKMNFYAWSSIVEVILKLIIVFMLTWFTFDKLFLYSWFMLGVVFCITMVYVIYCMVKFMECHYSFCWDKKLFQSMFGFAGWNLFASLANVGMNQGVNILLNMFFGPAINAARGIAFQVSSQVGSFVGNFQTAAAPQIIKYYAADQRDEMKKLYYQSSRFSYFLLFIVALPVLLEMNMLLTWWLTDVPKYTPLFTRLVIITVLADCLSGTTIPVVQATSKIKYYQIFVGTAILLNVPIAYLFLKLGYPPEITMVIAILLSTVALFIRLAIVKSLLKFEIGEYLNRVVVKNLIITISSLIIPSILYLKMNQTIFSFTLVVGVSIVSTLFSVYLWGLESNEKEKLIQLFRIKLEMLTTNSLR